MTKKDPAKLTSVKVRIPFFDIAEAEWTPDPTERKAAWALYVELVTRIAVQELVEDQGLLREALTSLYSVFPSTRQILREAGPDVGAKVPSVGGYAIGILNKGLRPFLTKWHPALQEWEATRLAGTGALAHERAWPRHDELREELNELRQKLEKYAIALGEIAGVAS